jgi:Asp-tRNA(Asn)/Glu-tRNA(Gln) amidotransferase C subunit
MVADASAGAGDGNEPATGLSKLDAALLKRVAELAAKEENPEELRTLAKAMIGVIQMQAEMAQCLSQFMELVSQENRKKADRGS